MSKQLQLWPDNCPPNHDYGGLFQENEFSERDKPRPPSSLFLADSYRAKAVAVKNSANIYLHNFQTHPSDKAVSLPGRWCIHCTLSASVVDTFSGSPAKYARQTFSQLSSF